jgi:tetratricopeptide (TPR) repeat protein
MDFLIPKKAWLIGLLWALAPVPARVYAQTAVTEETDQQRQEQQLQMDEAIRKAAQRAQSRKGLETPREVSFAEVLADPDNIELNFLYAQTQAAKGDLPGASATLERILMIDPNIPSVRLFLALIYLHLDNLEEANREFETLQQMPLTPAQRAQTDDSLKQIQKKQRRLKLFANSTMGWGYDTNRNAAPSSKQRMVLDAPLGLTGTSKRRPDTHMLAVKGLSFEQDLGMHAGHTWVGSFNYFLGEQTVADDLDMQSFALESGLVLNTPWMRLEPSGFANYLYLSRESYLRSQGLSARMTHEIGTRTQFSTTGTWTREDFLPIKENLAARERTGDRLALDLAGLYTLTSTMQLGATMGISVKNIDGPTEYNAYEGYSLTLNHTWLLGKGQFLLSSLTLGIDGYDEPDTAISSRRRRDEQLRARLAYGAPVELLIGSWLPNLIDENLTASLSVEQARSDSNVINYTYSNTKLDMLLSKQVEF